MDKTVRAKESIYNCDGSEIITAGETYKIQAVFISAGGGFFRFIVDNEGQRMKIGNKKSISGQLFV